MTERWPSCDYQARCKSQMFELHRSQAGYRAVLAWETLVNLNAGWQGEIKQQVLLKAPQDYIQPLQHPGALKQPWSHYSKIVVELTATGH